METRTPWWRSVLTFVGPLVLAAGVAVFLVGRYHHPASESALPPAPQDPVATRVDQDIARDAREVAGRFLLTAVAGKNLGASWDLVDPTYMGKEEYTRESWTLAKDGLPVIPVPGIERMETRFHVKYRSADEMTLDVLLIPRQGTPLTFDLGLKHRAVGAEKRWFVDYWMTNWDAPVRDANPG